MYKFESTPHREKTSRVKNSSHDNILDVTWSNRRSRRRCYELLCVIDRCCLYGVQAPRLPRKMYICSTSQLWHWVDRFAVRLLLRGAIVYRTYGKHQHIYIPLFLLTISDPIYYGPPCWQKYHIGRVIFYFWAPYINYYSFSCHPPMCSMIFNMDHS